MLVKDRIGVKCFIDRSLVTVMKCLAACFCLRASKYS